MLFFFGILISKQIAVASLFSFPLRVKTSFHKNVTDDSAFFYGSGKYRKHPNHTYGRNRNNSANNWANVFVLKMKVIVESLDNNQKALRKHQSSENLLRIFRKPLESHPRDLLLNKFTAIYLKQFWAIFLDQFFSKYIRG